MTSVTNRACECAFAKNVENGRACYSRGWGDFKPENPISVRSDIGQTELIDRSDHFDQQDFNYLPLTVRHHNIVIYRQYIVMIDVSQASVV
jgi:hypothetical protein